MTLLRLLLIVVAVVAICVALGFRYGWIWWAIAAAIVVGCGVLGWAFYEGLKGMG